MIKVRDIIIIICLLMFSAALYFASGNKEGSTVLIEYDGNLFTEVNFTGLGDEEIFTYYHSLCYEYLLGTECTIS